MTIPISVTRGRTDTTIEGQYNGRTIQWQNMENNSPQIITK